MPERELWQSVLLRAVEDALSEPPKGSANAKRRHEILDARTYLTRPSKDLSHVCSLAGVDMEALIDRMRKRIADLAPMEPVKAKPPRVRGIILEHDGRSTTIDQWEKITGISATIIRDRLRNGWTTADALTVPVGGMRYTGPMITHDGETLTIHQWAERTGIAWFTIRDRVRKGWPVEEVLRPGDLRGAHMKVQVA